MSAAPVSRRTRPAKAPLSRAVIVETGLRILDTDGAAALTMRRVAQELDTGAASLYVYVANRDDLMVAMLDDVIDAVPEPDGEDWRARLVTLIEDAMVAIGRHQGLALVALGSAPTETVRSRLLDRMRALLAEAGVDSRTGAWAVDLLYLHLVAAVADRGATDAVTAARHAEPSEDDAARARWSLRVLIDGIVATPAG
ncbi:TetR/AcrR family transcriptional regulator [Nocardia bovistercoris]|uniref:TetR/AcrR family transcriptional regulator C-terminal domain-containing protein n=1 Tax=Nocardia bovistercoris TaxID=2785916 RepID=A0A931IC69_9NOCA|nr:TetR family transcriptional regulator [Nocardia bovistercoris]MBH0777123.1 TetR/AcrR family transcriptional regulator C-terminal domain-containing protein [Nocardia bovistercoris]